MGGRECPTAVAGRVLARGKTTAPPVRIIAVRARALTATLKRSISRVYGSCHLRCLEHWGFVAPTKEYVDNAA